MTSPTYGITILESTTSALPVMASDLSVIGLVLPADDAVAALFPLNTPVAFNSSDPSYLAGAGTGDLSKALTSINNQLAQFQSAAQIVAVLVTRGADLTTTIANLLGSQAAGTGIYALLRAGTLTGFVPRLIGAPGYTGYMQLGASEPVMTEEGTGYVLATTNVVFTPAGAQGTPIIGANGAITGINLTNPGAYAPGVEVAGTITVNEGAPGTGAAFTFSLVPQANSICAALPAVLTSLLGVSYVGSSGDGVLADDFAWRQTLSSDRLNPCDAWVIPGAGGAFTDGAAEALGLQVAVDFQNGGMPFNSISGQQVQGIGGLKNYWTFSLTDGATQGQQLLAQQISTIAAGSISSDTAVSSSGFEWVGVWNANTSPLLWFSNKRRGKDYVNLALIKAIRTYLGVDNVTPHAIQAVLNSMSVLGSQLVNIDASLGFQVSFVPSANSPSQLQQGQFTVNFANEIPAPITGVTVQSTDYPAALTVELATIIAQANTIAPQYIGAN